MPNLRKNLFSVGMCTKKGFDVKSDKERVTVMRENEIAAIGAKQSNEIYGMLFRVMKPSENTEVKISSIDPKLWHECLGHVGARALCDMVRGGLVEGVKLKNTEKFVCEPCQFGKSHVQTIRERPGKQSTEPGECVHTDVCGPTQVDSLGARNIT